VRRNVVGNYFKEELIQARKKEWKSKGELQHRLGWGGRRVFKRELEGKEREILSN